MRTRRASTPATPGPARAPRRPAAIAEWWKELDITKAALGGLTDFGASFAVSAVGAGAKWAFGRFLDFYGLNEIKDFILPKSDTERLLEMVQQINIRLNNLEASSDRLLKAIAELSTSVLAGRATELLTHINTNHNTLVSLTKLDPSKPGLMGGTRGLLDNDRPRRAEPQPAPRRPGGQRRRARAARRGLAARRRRAVLHDRRLEVHPPALRVLRAPAAAVREPPDRALEHPVLRAARRSQGRPRRPASRPSRSRGSSTSSARTSWRSRRCSSPRCPTTASSTSRRTSSGSATRRG